MTRFGINRKPAREAYPIKGFQFLKVREMLRKRCCAEATLYDRIN